MAIGAGPITIIFLTVHITQWPNFELWYFGIDQIRYLEAARAWAALDFDPVRHYYLPGWSLLAAPFVPILPEQPFAIPSFLTLLLTLWLTIRVTAKAFPEEPHAPLIASLCFLLSLLSTRTSLAAWVFPWTTSASIPLILLGMDRIILWAERLRLRDLFYAVVAASLAAWFRPSDAALALAIMAAFAGWRLLTLSWQAWLSAAAIGIAGLLVAILPLLAVHLLIHGFALGEYLTFSRSIGFDLSLVPLRWVTIVLAPGPLFSHAGPGLTAALPWVLPGGIALGILMASRGTGHGARALLGATVLAFLLTYLSYRDLQPHGIWRFQNLHYFKGIVPFLAIACVMLLRRPSKGRHAVLLRGLLVLSALISAGLWRADVTWTHTLERSNGITVDLGHGQHGTHSVWFLPTYAANEDIYFGNHRIEAGTRSLLNTIDFKAFPYPAGMIVMPLRDFPDGPLKLFTDPRVAIEPGRPGRVGQVTFRFAPPCLWRGCVPPASWPAE